MATATSALNMLAKEGGREEGSLEANEGGYKKKKRKKKEGHRWVAAASHEIISA